MSTYREVTSRWNRGRSREGGLLLIELMVTLFTVVLAMLALGRLQGEIITAAATARHRERALTFALNRLEDMRFVSLGSDSLASSSGEERLGPPGSGVAHELPGLERVYVVRWEVRPEREWRDDLRVDVRWREPNAGELSLEIQSRLCRIPRYVPLVARSETTLRQLFQTRSGY